MAKATCANFGQRFEGGKCETLFEYHGHNVPKIREVQVYDEYDNDGKPVTKQRSVLKPICIDCAKHLNKKMRGFDKVSLKAYGGVK